MPRIDKSPESRVDAEEIWHYIAQDSAEAADRLLQTFDAKLKLLADHPGLGRRRDELAAGLRSFPIGSYLLFYRSIADGIQIVRILHGARDLYEIFKHHA